MRSEAGDLELRGRRSTSVQEPAHGVRWIIAPYAWMYGMDGEATVNNSTADVDVGFDDILENLDLSLQGHVEGWRGTWGLFADAQYGELSGDGDLGPIGLDVTSTMTLAELGAVSRVIDRTLEEATSRRFTTDVLVGARYYGLDLEIDFDPPALSTIDGDESWIDGFAGARCEWDFSSRLSLAARGDVGGFEIGDSSDLAWQAQALLGWQMGKGTTLAAGYRILDVDYDHGSFGYDVQISGPVIGVVFEL
jgi:hypothetical protein